MPAKCATGWQPTDEASKTRRDAILPVIASATVVIGEVDATHSTTLRNDCTRASGRVRSGISNLKCRREELW